MRRLAAAVVGLCSAGLMGIVAVPLLMIAALGGGAGQQCETPDAPLPGTGPPSVEGLSDVQVGHARTIVAVGEQMAIPPQGVVVALAVASQESHFQNYANDGLGGDLAPEQRDVDRSLQFPHDAVGTDHGSVNVFQQQYPWWGTLEQLLHPPTAARSFYESLLKVPGWETLPVTVAAQRVQRSAYPSAYADDEPLARELLTKLSGTGGDMGAGLSTCLVGGSFTPFWRDDFNGTALSKDWSVFGGAGNGHGAKAPQNITVHDGYADLVDAPVGGVWHGAGMCACRASLSTYGRYQIRAQLDPGPHSKGVALLWPAEGEWPEDGEIDFLETAGIGDEQRTTVNFTNHYGSVDPVTKKHPTQRSTYKVDLTQWHTYAVEWTPGGITYYVDGVLAAQQLGHAPAGPMWLGMMISLSEEGHPDRPIHFRIDWVQAEHWAPAPDGGTGSGGGTPTESIPCAVGGPGRVDSGPGGVRIRICQVGTFDVDTTISAAVARLISEGQAAGFTFTGGGYRSHAEQIALRRAHCGPSHYDIWEKPASQCSPPTAIPGQSMHEWGLALDISSNGRLINSRNDPAFRWLAANASKYGLINLPSEPWHWSSSGT